MDTGNTNLKPYNTFGIAVDAEMIETFSSVSELHDIIQRNKEIPKLVLGGGSNVLFTKNYNGLVLLNRILGIQVLSENENEIIIKVGSGEVWHQFVMHCVKNNWGGIENLSLIPGSVGASPMQNIGAYGVEIKDVFVELEAYEIATGQIRNFSHEQCNFGYRESIFKRELKNQFIIVSVTYRLSKKPRLNSSYGAINEELQKMNIELPTIQNVSDAVISIRKSKLPDPNEIGNAGSFFKNPVVSIELLNRIQDAFDNVPNYPISENEVKLAAGWLIEKAGWKGKNMGNYGVHEKQALVLVNYGNASGNQILDLSEQIIIDIQSKFGVTLEREVNII